MAYQSHRNPTGFHGLPSPWATSAANWSFSKLIETSSRVGFFAKHDATSTPVYISPRVAADSVGLCMLYAPKRSLSPALLAAPHVRELLEKQWRALCRAYIDVDICPRGQLAFVDHDATIRAANELLTPHYPWTPSPDEFDIALGTSLSLITAQTSQNAMRILGCNW